jgi:hypothetical protein
VSVFLNTKVPGVCSVLACVVLAAAALASLLMAGQLMTILNRGLDRQSSAINHQPTTLVNPG